MDPFEVVGLVIIGLIAIYVGVRMGSAAYFRSKYEALARYLKKEEHA